MSRLYYDDDDGVIRVCQEPLVDLLKVLFYYSSTAKQAEGIITIASNVPKNHTAFLNTKCEAEVPVTTP